MDLSYILNFSLYFLIACVYIVLFKIIYAFVTPHDEWKLIKEEQNVAAAIGLGGAVLGYAIAISGVISNSVSLIDFAIWSLVALVAQLIAFSMVRFIFMPKIVARIENNELSAGVILASISIAVGLINSACMTY